MELAERMGLTILYLPVHQHQGIPSILFWEEGTLEVKEMVCFVEKKPDIATIPGNTIVVNTNVTREEYGGFHIFHECIHSELYYMACRLQKLVSNDIHQIKFEKVSIWEAKKRVDPVHFMEKQANRGAYGLMMPESSMRRMIEESVTIPDAVSGSGYKKDDISVYLNGMIVPVAESAWDFKDGDIIIHSSPAIIGSVNIVYDGKGTVAKALTILGSLFSIEARAQG